MKTKQGYQKTKLGWIPVDWEVVKLGDISKVTSGGTPSRKMEEYWGGDVPWVTTSEIKWNEIVTAKEFITKEGLDNSSAKLFHKGTLLIALYGQGITRGKVSMLGIEAATNQACAAILLETDRVSKNYLFHYLVYKYHYMRSLSNDGGQQNLSGGIVKKIPFPLPPLPEQKKIAKILSTWDTAITKTKALIEKKQELKKGLMQVLLTGKVLTTNDSNWKEFVLSDLGNTYNGLTGKTKEHFGKGKPFITYMNIFKNGKIDSSIYGLVEINENDKQNQVQYGDIFFTVSSETPHEIGMTSVLLDDLKETYLNSFCFSFRLNDFSNLLPEYAVYYFRGGEFRREMIQLAQGATRFNLSKKNTLKLKLNLPSLPEQKKIAKVLNTCDQGIEKLNDQLAQLQAQKKGLMQQLLTGATRVKVEA